MRHTFAVGLASLLLCAPLASAPAVAANPFPKGDAKAGEALHEKDCVACHSRRFDGDGARMYLRPDHRVRTPAQLRAQIAWCNAQLGTKYFPEEEEHIAAFLNARYYRFAQ